MPTTYPGTGFGVRECEQATEIAPAFAIFNQQRLDIMILQVAIVGIIALGVTQVIIIGGIDLSSGSVVGVTAMVVMSFAQTALVNGNPNPKAIFGDFIDGKFEVILLWWIAAMLVVGRRDRPAAARLLPP